MARLRQFRLPDLGEGLTEGEILQWMVAPGDTVRLNQPLVEVETAKAAVEVPSPFAGVVAEIHHRAGETVDVGATLITIDTDPAPGPLEPAAAALVDRAPAEAAELVPAGGPTPGGQGALIGETGANGRTATLVGYGPRSGAARRRPRAASPPAAPAAPVPSRIAAVQVGEAAAVRVGRATGGVTVLAKPPVRKLARALGVDLAVLHGTGPRGTVTREDVEAAARQHPAAQQGPAVQRPAAAPAAGALYDPSTRERRVPVTGVRRLTAAAMVGSAFTAPHVTEFLTLDVTPTMELRDRVAALPEFRDVKVTPLLFAAKALLLAVRRHPEVNSTFTEDEIVVKDYVNLGIAAATPRGLVVPNIKDADRLDLLGLAQALQELSRTAKEGRTPPADMQHGTITITNVGVFGVDTGTPILNPGESAILCLGAVRPMPWVHEGQLAVRQVTQLSLSFDHRNVDGQLGAQFLADIGRVLSDPAQALLM